MGGWTDQQPFDVRFEWGPAGVAAVAGEIVVVVDVLRFTTAVDAATSHGVAVLPHHGTSASAATFARDIGAVLANGAVGAPSLSPASLVRLQPGSRVVLPSPNGSTCSALAHEAGAVVVAACLRNATAVATWLNERRGTVTVIASGERFPDGSLRPDLEDLLGAGAVISALTGRPSPEAQAAAAAWRDAAGDVVARLAACSSGREAIELGRDGDLAYASALDASAAVPVLVDGAFVDGARLSPPPDGTAS